MKELRGEEKTQMTTHRKKKKYIKCSLIYKIFMSTISQKKTEYKIVINFKQQKNKNRKR